MNRTTSDKPSRQFAVAIVGGGFTGATLAAQVLRMSAGSASVVLIERSARAGLGVAYGTSCIGHLLNVRARNMSAYTDDPEHFLRWARIHHTSDVKPDDYLPRKLYGQYVASLLQEQTERHSGQFLHMQSEAVSLTRVGEKTEIRLRNGLTVVASKVVLALGNFPPGDPRLPGKNPHSVRFVSDPWRASAFTGVAADENVLLVGSGLTSVDVAIALRARGFTGTIHVLSRRGLLPQNHQAASPWPPFWDEKSPRSVRGLLRLIRSQVAAAESSGSDWRSVVDSLRPFTQGIWRSLPLEEQRRFLRHVRPYWEVHRHRIAPQIGSLLASQMQSGQLEIHAGRISAYNEDFDGVDVTYRDRKTKEFKQLRVGHVINCTGPEVDCRRIENYLLSNLIRQGLVRPDSLFLGLDASESGALMNAGGEPSDFLYTVGPSRKGSLWETTAVPEIRGQVAVLAKLLCAGSEPKDPKPLRREPDAENLRGVTSGLRL